MKLYIHPYWRRMAVYGLAMWTAMFTAASFGEDMMQQMFYRDVAGAPFFMLAFFPNPVSRWLNKNTPWPEV